MKQWPRNNKPANISDLCDEVVKAIRFAYKVKRKNRGKDIPLTGPDAPETGLAPCGSRMLTSEQLRISEEDQDRDALSEIVWFALRLGIEQGRRITLTGSEFKSLQTELEILRIKNRGRKTHP